jgi:hypothetical protein
MDRFFRGLIAGMAGGAVMNIWSFISYDLLNFTNVRFIDWSAVFIFGDRPGNFIETIMALVSHILWSGFLGILMAILFSYFTSRGYLIKGAFFGFITGFIIYAIPVLFNVQLLEFKETATAASNMIGGILWGLTTAYVLRLLDSTPNLRV